MYRTKAKKDLLQSNFNIAEMYPTQDIKKKEETGYADLIRYQQLRGASNQNISYQEPLSQLLYVRHKLAIILLSGTLAGDQEDHVREAFELYNYQIKKLLFL